jgi:signal transduction histidine kinase
VRGVGLAGWSLRRLRLVLGLFLLALAIPTGLLVAHAYEQLQWQAFRQQQRLAEELTARIDAQLSRLVDAEEARAFADYAFLVAGGEATARFVQRSPLSSYPPAPGLPGLVGHFQVDGAGTLTSPLVPREPALAKEYGVGADELVQRIALRDELRRLLAGAVGRGERVVAREAETAKATPSPQAADSASAAAAASGARRKDAPAEAKSVPQSVFDALADAAPPSRATDRGAPLGRVEDLKLAERFQQAAPAAGGAPAPAPLPEAQTLARAEKRGVRKERSAIVDAATPETDAVTAQAGPVAMFGSEIGPFQARRLDSGHFVLFRDAWRDGQRYVQGLLLAQGPFLAETVGSALRETVLSQTTDVVVAWRSVVLTGFAGQASRRYAVGTEGLAGELLYRTRLSAPLDGLELVYSVGSLPAGPGASIVGWLATVLALVMLGGVFLLYRLGARQLALARQQQDFVAAVSHELKTPLTSIRMYGEMLREGWAPEEKKAAYYAYIHDESERLTRLIGNVLQLARMTRDELRLAPRSLPAGELLATATAKIASQVERAGFALLTESDGKADAAVVELDPDAFSQILINLVDNAIKFSGQAANKSIDIGCRLAHGSRVAFSVRDHGPGVPRDQMRKIFRLFYRGEEALTRETAGTGIGLALVRQLADAMGGTVDVQNRDPGAEFTVTFPLARPASPPVP